MDNQINPISKISKTRGNYAVNGDSFPVDAAYLEEMENNVNLSVILGNIVDGGGDIGSGYILSGCTPDTLQNNITAGYIFLRTNAYPTGEVLYFVGGIKTTKVSVHEESINAYGGNSAIIHDVYRHRYLKPATTGSFEAYPWTSLKEFNSIKKLIAVDETNTAELAELRSMITDTRPPIGTVHMWAAPASKLLPIGYLPCDGRALSASEYAELYDIIGEIYGANGAHTEFNLPDMRGLFVVGSKASEADYSEVGKRGGKATHQLSMEEMPTHSHKQGSESINNLYGGGNFIGNRTYPGGPENSYYNSLTSSEGGGKAHENRPPYFVITYIIRVK